MLRPKIPLICLICFHIRILTLYPNKDEVDVDLLQTAQRVSRLGAGVENGAAGGADLVDFAFFF